MARNGKHLTNKLSTVFSEYAPRAFEASETAEQRLIELEQRDQHRQRRDDQRREQLRDKYGV